jgi:excisionase family DNA binding protein
MPQSQGFTRAAQRWNAHPVELEDGLLRWRKSDLDLLIKRLAAAPTFWTDKDLRSSSGQCLTEIEIGRIAEALAKRLEGLIPSEQRLLVSIKEAGRMLGISRTTVYELINEGRLTSHPIGRRNLIPMREIQAIVDG